VYGKKIAEKRKDSTSAFEGLVIAVKPRQGSWVQLLTVRKVTSGVGVEKFSNYILHDCSIETLNDQK